MSAKLARWEVVRTGVGYHARFIAPNGRTVVTSEVYKRSRGALHAIRLVTGREPYEVHGGWFIFQGHTVEIRRVDERAAEATR